MKNEEIQRHIEENCRNVHGEPMMDEQAFYEGAKWMRDKALSLGAVVGRLSMQEVLNYEIHSHWLASWIGFEWGQELMGKYFAWKVRRKYNRYLVSLEERKRVLNGL